VKIKKFIFNNFFFENNALYEIILKNKYKYFFRNFLQKIQVSLKSDKNNGDFTRRSTYSYDHISLNSP